MSINKIAILGVLIMIAATSCGKKSTIENVFVDESDPELIDTDSLQVSDMADITGILVGLKELSTLSKAIIAADLEKVLKQEGPYTVFAPTDDAFQKLQEGTVDDLLNPENKDLLISILKMHVVPGTYLSSDLENQMRLETLNGESVLIVFEDGNVKVNSAFVVGVDIEGINGVVHIVDQVILPVQ